MAEKSGGITRRRTLESQPFRVIVGNWIVIGRTRNSSDDAREMKLKEGVTLITEFLAVRNNARKYSARRMVMVEEHVIISSLAPTKSSVLQATG